MILLTGGSGLLGTELQKHIKGNCEVPTHRQLNIYKKIPDIYHFWEKELIIHSAGYTDVVKAEKDRFNCFKVNVEGTINLLKFFLGVPFVYISSEYAHNPINYYSETKLAGEVAVKAFSDRYLIIRTLFKPKPFPFDKAFIDKYTQGDYVDKIAPLILDEIDKWDKKTSKTVYVGTGRKTMYDLAKQTKPDVEPISVNDIKGVKLPKDYL